MRRVSHKHSVYIVSQKHSVYIRPLDANISLTPGSQTLTYCVNQSPAKVSIVCLFVVINLFFEGNNLVM